MIYIRVDMNEEIATGHVMRCLSIADAAKARGEAATFILADGKAVELIETRGYQSIVLGTCWKHMDSELPVLKRVIEENKIQRILIDSYQVTESYLMGLKSLVEIVYIDDINRFVYPVDYLVCYANYWEKFNYTERYQIKGLCLGLEYVPLRSEFSRCGKKEISKKAGRLLMMSGGTDKYEVLPKLLEELDKTLFEEIEVICGVYNPQYEYLCKKYRNFSNIRMHRAVTDMIDFMKNADIAVSAGGTTLYELCAAGTPTISYSMADNQLDNVKKFQADGIIDYAGDIRYDNVIENIIRYLNDYYDDDDIRKKKSLKMQALVDGKGALRIAEILCKQE